jgi:hypothetical protein
LVFGGLAVVSQSAGASPLLASGWGFAGLYVALIAASMAWCLAGLALTLLALRNPS